jgi:hypothetical protein
MRTLINVRGEIRPMASGTSIAKEEEKRDEELRIVAMPVAIWQLSNLFRAVCQ